MILYCPGRWSIAQPCEQIVGLSNRIVYEYAKVDSSIVWIIV
ncbi:MAG: HepT-like ribonuclease domain-containing protein [Rubrobacteraceae bacterium]